MNSLRFFAVILTVCAAVACGDDDGGGGDDGGNGIDGGASACPVTCAAEEACRYGICVPEPGACASTEDCAGDSYCDLPAGECLPWGVGPGGFQDDACTREVVAGVFYPDVQCEWLGPPAGDAYPAHKNVLGAPVVVDFRGSGDPELSRPSIVFLSYDFTDGGFQSCRGDEGYRGVIRVIDGRTCEQQATIDAPAMIASTSLAVGDLTGDGIAEIVAPTVGGGLAAFQMQDGGAFSLLWETAATPAAGLCVWTGPALHDLDDDGLPEIIYYGSVFDAGGGLISADLGPLTGGSNGYIPVVADVDADEQPELVYGAAIYGWNDATRTWDLEQSLGGDAQTAVADFGTYPADAADDDRAALDGIAEIVTIRAGMATVFNVHGRAIFGPAALVGVGTGGAPTIADFDGDGRVEFASANGTAYSVFDLDCLGTPDPATCPSETATGILWSQPSQDGSSNVTGSSVFDFEGDGTAEVVYADECFTRVYDGRTGDVTYSRFRTSCTWYEQPVIADVDADFGAEIVVGSNTNCNIACPAVDPIFDGIRCFDESDCPGATECRRNNDGDEVGFCRCELDADCGGDGFVCLDPIAGPAAQGKVCRASHGGTATAFGLRVIGDKLGRWVATRPIWNQHAYAVTNVEDTGRIPRTSVWLRNWVQAGLNNFRQNSPGEGAGAGLMPDLTVKGGGFTCTASGAADLDLEVCNRGTEPVADGVAIAVYAAGDALACTTATPTLLRPGNCATASCSVTGVPTGQPAAYKVVVDDDGAEGAHTECREQNNAFVLEGVVCP